MLRTRVNYWAVLVAAVTTLVTSALYYVVLGSAYMTLRGIDPNTTQVTPQAWQMVGQVTRNLVVAFVLAHLIATWKRALQAGLLVWFGFQAMAVAGSVLHEGYPLGLYLIHVGDALQATLLMALILGAWRRGRRQAVDTSSAAFTTS
jgi:predicted Co/Zn/Cd cation transporter (cation efflux family)